jgi:PAS domain S-box-containing protein
MQHSLLESPEAQGMARADQEACARAFAAVDGATAALSTAARADEQLRTVVDALGKPDSLGAVAVFEARDGTSKFDLVHAGGFASLSSLAEQHSLPEGSVAGAAVRAHDMAVVSEPGRDPMIGPAIVTTDLRRPPARAIAISLELGGRVLGVLVAVQDLASGLSARERSALANLGRLVALVLGRVRDARAIANAEHAASRQERAESAILRPLGAGVFLFDLEGRVTFMNQAAERMTGWRESDALRHRTGEVVNVRPVDTTRPHRDLAAEALRTQGVVPAPHDALLVSRDGSERTICGSACPMTDDGGVCGGEMVLFDTTPNTRDHVWLCFLHEASVALGESLDYEATIGRVARLAISAHARGIDLEDLFWKKIAALGGWRFADACAVDVVLPDGGGRCLKVAHADPTHEPALEAVLRGADGSASPFASIQNVTRRGTSYVSLDLLGDDARTIGGPDDPELAAALRRMGLRSVLTVPIPSPHGVVGSILLASHDPQMFQPSDVERGQELAHLFSLALENARLYRQARDALTVREEFLSVASHELRTPLTSLQLLLSMLERTYRSEHDLSAKLHRVREQVDRLGKLSESLIDVTRLSSGRMVLTKEESDLRAAVAHALEGARPDAIRAGCAIRMNDGPDVRGWFDIRRIEQAVRCLVENAIKFGAGRPVEVAVERAGDSAQVSVTDHGIGIAQADTHRIFDRFERAVSTRHYGGLGLGLYVASEIVEAHGGSILVATEPGAGSTFRTVLPLRSAAAPRDASTTEAPRSD